MFNLLKLFGIQLKPVDITYGDTEIKPCPHCGAEGVKTVLAIGTVEIICKRQCKLEFMLSDAIKKWNRRK